MMSQYMNSKEYEEKIGKITPKKIGSGTYGNVFETSKKFAVKVQSTREDISYIREIAILRYLNHPNIIKPEGQLFTKHTDEIHIAMKKAESTLVDFIDSTPDIETITSISYQILDALAYMEKKSVIHRDIKPENILVYGNNVQICDFGLGKYFIDGKNSYTSHTSNVQTLWYRSPEVTLQQGYNFKADVWSVGAIILEMTGNESFREQRLGFLKDSVDAKRKGKCRWNKKKFVFKWFSYLIGSIPKTAEWAMKIPDNWVRDKSSLYKLCRFTDHPLIELAFKLLAWESDDRLSAREALSDKCFANITKPKIPEEIKEQQFEWYDQEKSLQQQIGRKHRGILMGWIWDVIYSKNMGCQTPAMTYALIDLFLSRRDVSKSELQLVGLACLSIVDKFHEANIYSYDDWVRMTINLYSVKQLIEFEQIILCEVNFDFMRIFHQILSHRLDEGTWFVVSCFLCMDNPKSIESILAKSNDEKWDLVSSFKWSDRLKKKCLEKLRP